MTNPRAEHLLFEAQELAPGPPQEEALRQCREKMLILNAGVQTGRPGTAAWVRLQPDDNHRLNLDHRAGFVLAQIDGSVSYEDLFALSGRTRLDTARSLAQLLDGASSSQAEIGRMMTVQVL